MSIYYLLLTTNPSYLQCTERMSKLFICLYNNNHCAAAATEKQDLFGTMMKCLPPRAECNLVFATFLCMEQKQFETVSDVVMRNITIYMVKMGSMLTITKDDRQSMCPMSSSQYLQSPT